MGVPDNPGSASARVGADPTVGIVINTLTPYWLHLFRRFVREIDGVRFVTCSIFGGADQPWSLEQTREINHTQIETQECVSKRGVRDALTDWRKGGRVIRWLQEHRVRAVIVGGYSDACRARVIRWCRAHGVRVFMIADSNIRSAGPALAEALVKRVLLRAILRRLDGVLVCGRNGADYFTSYGVPHAKIFVCPMEPDYSLIESITGPEVAAAMLKHRLAPGRRHLLTCSRLVGVKRVDLAIDAFAGIAAERPDWDMVIIGSGPEEAALRARVPHALQDRVRFTGFVGDQREVSALYRACHVLVHAAEYEPFGLVIPEAAAAGLAIVTSSVVGASPEIVAEGVNGRFFPVGNTRLLTEALRDATDPDRTTTYQANSVGMSADWRRRRDPVKGLVEALSSVGMAARWAHPPENPGSVPRPRPAAAAGTAA